MQIVFLLCILIGLGELGIGIRQSISVVFNDCSYQNINGTFDNPGPYSNLIVMILPIAWFYVWQIKTISVKKYLSTFIYVLAFVYVLLSFIVLPFTMSRTSWLAAILSCGLVSFLCIKKYKKQTIKYKYITIYVCICILLAGIIYGLKKDSADGRILIWKVSSSVVKAHYLKGVGSGYFPGAYGEAQEDYFRNKRATEHEKYLAGAPEYAYNEYIQIIAEYGIAGIIALIAFIGYSFYHLTQIENDKVIPVMGALVSLLVVSSFSYPFRNVCTCLFAVSIIITAIILPDAKKSRKNMITRYLIHLFTLCVIFYKICLSDGFLGNNKTAYRQWNLLKPFFDRSQFDKITQNYTVLYPYLKSNARFLFEYGQCLSQIKQYQKSNIILEKGLSLSSDPMFLNILGKNYQQMGKYQLAEKMFYKAHYRIPHRIYPLFLLMNLYKDQQRVHDMLYIATIIVNKKEKIVTQDAENMKKEARKIIQEVCHDGNSKYINPQSEIYDH